MNDVKRNLLAGIIVIAWILAAASGTIFDVRLTIGLTAIGLAITSVALWPKVLAALFAVAAERSTGELSGRRLVGVCLAATLVMVVATYGLFPVVAGLAPATRPAAAGLYQLMRVPYPSAGILALLSLIVLSEEVVWRGMVYEAVQAHTKPLWTVLLTAALYGLCHAPIGSPLLVLVAIACGLYWSLLRWKTQSLWPSLVSHLVWDIAIVTHPLVRLHV